MNPHVSIITACYNSENFIKDTLQSVINQTYQDWEWIIVDDCSHDNTVKIIKENTDSRIKLIELNKNEGAALARNHGIKIAKGRYLAFIDSDDLWNYNALENRLNFLKKNHESIVYTSYKRVNEKLEPILNNFIAEDHVTFKRLLKNNPIFISTLVYDTEIIGKILFPNVNRREDHAMFFNLLNNGREARALNEPLTTYRIRSKSYSRNKWLMLKLQFLVYYDFLNLSLMRSIYYTILWGINGLKKYSK